MAVQAHITIYILFTLCGHYTINTNHQGKCLISTLSGECYATRKSHEIKYSESCPFCCGKDVEDSVVRSDVSHGGNGTEDVGEEEEGNVERMVKWIRIEHFSAEIEKEMSS